MLFLMNCSHDNLSYFYVKMIYFKCYIRVLSKIEFAESVAQFSCKQLFYAFEINY